MRILIIDDDEDIVSFIKMRLESKCFAVDTAINSSQALAHTKTNDYDLILLDYSLPGKNGFDICHVLRENNNHTPIIMISVTTDVSHKIQGLNLGIDDYVTKPFYFDELFARMQAILRRPRYQETRIMSLQDLRLDATRQMVRRGTKSIYLTKKEFSLLEYLLKHSGNVVSRGSIIEHVWDRELDPFSNTIETHILNLRKKIDHSYKNKLIHSVPGRGYKLAAEK